MRQLRFADAADRRVKQSGFADKGALRTFLKVDDNDLVYLVEFRYLDDTAVNVPPRQELTNQQRSSLAQKLAAMDARSSRGPWACRTLALIGEHPETRAADLARVLGWDTPPFKANVRKLKQLGLTTSLEVGYRLTDRGIDVLSELGKP